MHTDDEDSAATQDFFFEKRKAIQSAPLRKMDEKSSPATVRSSVKKEKLGRYVDLGVLGIGAMGEVRKVQDEKLRRTLAMKIIHKKFLSNQALTSRFIEEAQIGAQLQHPNITPVYELGVLSDRRHYFTMKEIRGRTFGDLIESVHKESDKRWKPAQDGTTFRRLIQIFHKTCETIAYAHSMAVVHRDLKPENIMIGGFGEVLVVDWGLAKVLTQSSDALSEESVETQRSQGIGRDTKMGQITGTPLYMSPEQAQGRVDLLDHLSDIYTLGSILFEVMNGTPPYTGNSVEEVLEKVKQGESLSLPRKTSHDISDGERQNMSPTLPDPLIDICEKAMNKDRTSRYQSATELANDVFSWLEGAQRRDKALLEIEAANKRLQIAEQQEEESNRLWIQANRIITEEGVDSKGWEIWKQAQEKAKESKKNRRLYTNQFAGALVYSPSLEQVHYQLAKEHMDILFEVSVVGDHQQKEVQQQIFQNHLSFLPQTVQEEMKETTPAFG